MAENKRRTHVNSIKRNRDFVISQKFMEEDRHNLATRLEMLKGSYALFIEEHNTLVTALAGEKFNDQDKYFCEMEDIYRKVVTKFGMRISELAELERLKKEVSAMQESLNSKPDESTDSPASPNQKESIPIYLREQEKTENSIKNLNDKNGSQWDKENAISNHDLRHQIERNRRQLRLVKENIGKYTKRVYCNNCGRNHPMHRCPEFRAMNILERRERVRKLKLCENCFMCMERDRDGHFCRFGKCRRCNRGEHHNSLLCLN